MNDPQSKGRLTAFAHWMSSSTWRYLSVNIIATYLLIFGDMYEKWRGVKSIADITNIALWSLSIAATSYFAIALIAALFLFVTSNKNSRRTIRQLLDQAPSEPAQFAISITLLISLPIARSIFEDVASRHLSLIPIHVLHECGIVANWVCAILLVVITVGLAIEQIRRCLKSAKMFEQ